MYFEDWTIGGAGVCVIMHAAKRPECHAYIMQSLFFVPLSVECGFSTFIFAFDSIY